MPEFKHLFKSRDTLSIQETTDDESGTLLAFKNKLGATVASVSSAGVVTGTGLGVSGGSISVETYGAVGGGGNATANTAAIQAAAIAAIAAQVTLTFPNPPYDFNDTINFVPPGANTEFRLDVTGRGGFNALNYVGPSSKTMFYIKGLKDSLWREVNLRSTGTCANVVGFDLDTDASHQSTSCNTFIGCNFFDSSSGAGNIGWRISPSGGAYDNSMITWINCRISGHLGAGSMGWKVMNGNSKGFTWIDSGADNTDIIWSNASGGTTSGDFQWFGCLGTATNVDFQLFGTNRYAIYGYRGESGKRFLDTTNSSTFEQITISSVTLALYAPADGVVFNFNNRPWIVNIDNLQAYGSDYTSNFISVSNNSGVGPGYMRIMGCIRCAPGVTPINIDTNDYGIELDFNVVRLNSVSQSIGFCQPPDSPTTITYSASMSTNAARRGPFKITATNGTAFTIIDPVNPKFGKVITYDIKNSSGGAHGVITWGTAFLNGGAGTVGSGAFTGIANGKRRTITFYFDGTNWIEMNRTADM